MVMVRDKCGFKHGLFVASNGSSDGLAMLWKETVKLDMQNFFMSHIDAWVDRGPGVGWWHLTGFYGNPETRRRPESWAKLKHLRTTSSLPWLVIRDFNELMGMSEKERGGNRPRQQMANFVEAVNWCGLKDIGFIGPKFTWFYERSDGSQIRDRLDKALATFDWVNLFPMACLHHLTSSASDHSPLELHFVGKTNAKKPKKLFRFESMWLKESWCEEVIMMSDFHDDKDAKLVVTLASALWYNRNEVRHGKIKKSAMAFVQWSRQYLRESQAANQVVSSPVVPRVVGWSPPPTARYKVNIDGSVFSAQKCAGVGVMIKDSNGQVIAALSRNFNEPLGALEVEAKAFEVSLEFACDVGVQDFILKGDSLVVYNALCGSSTPPTVIASVLGDRNLDDAVFLNGRRISYLILEQNPD
nr:hypothetical protein CFP56_74007 [Quercus suber]